MKLAQQYAERKNELEKEIVKVVNSFEEETGFLVDNIKVDRSTMGMTMVLVRIRETAGWANN